MLRQCIKIHFEERHVLLFCLPPRAQEMRCLEQIAEQVVGIVCHLVFIWRVHRGWFCGRLALFSVFNFCVVDEDGLSCKDNSRNLLLRFADGGMPCHVTFPGKASPTGAAVMLHTAMHFLDVVVQSPSACICPGARRAFEAALQFWVVSRLPGMKDRTSLSSVRRQVLGLREGPMAVWTGNGHSSPRPLQDTGRGDSASNWALKYPSCQTFLPPSTLMHL